MTDKITSVLFACNMNSVRSPMAEALAKQVLGSDVTVESCGCFEGILDPFVALVLQEVGVPIPTRAPQTFSRININDYDRVIALTPEAAAEARRLGAKVTFWDTDNPTDVRGADDEIIGAYRDCRDMLKAKIAETFPAIA